MGKAHNCNLKANKKANQILCTWARWNGKQREKVWLVLTLDSIRGCHSRVIGAPGHGWDHLPFEVPWLRQVRPVHVIPKKRFWLSFRENFQRRFRSRGSRVSPQHLHWPGKKKEHSLLETLHFDISVAFKNRIDSTFSHKLYHRHGKTFPRCWRPLLTNFWTTTHFANNIFEKTHYTRKQT